MLDTWGGFDLAVLFTPFTPDRQNTEQLCWSTPGADLIQLFSLLLLLRTDRTQIKDTGTSVLEYSRSGLDLEILEYSAFARRHHGTVLLRTFWPAAAYFLKKLNNFSKNRHINSLYTLPYSPQESKPDKLKIKPLWPKTRYQ